MDTTVDNESNNFLKTLSEQRVGRYLTLANNNIGGALKIYTFNAKISQSFYIPLQALEITLRNEINTVLVKQVGNFWFDGPKIKLIDHQLNDIEKTKERIKNDKRQEIVPVTHDRVIAGLTFGFWVSMFSPQHDELWKTRLFRIVRSNTRGINRKTFSSALKDIRDIRNRIAHHECILEYNLENIYENILRLTSFISKDAIDWIKDNSTFEEINKYKPTYGLYKNDTAAN